MQTYGIFAVTPRTISVRDDKDNGWVADIKWAFTAGARPERKLTLDHVATLKGAAREGGSIKLEITPRLDGDHLPPVLLGAHLRGNITIDADGAVQCTTRVTFDELETAGLGVDAILGSSNCLECRVSDQPTLEESIGQEVKAERQRQQDHAQLMAELGADPLIGQAHEAPGAEEPVFEDAGELPPIMALDPKEPGEDLPFPIEDEGAAG